MNYASYFVFSSRRRHTRWPRDWSSDVCSSDLNYLFFEGKSNLLEGSKITGNITDPNDLVSSAWSSSHTQVNPDGSFQLQIHYWDLREGMEMHFEFDPDNNGWDRVLDTYGQEGENLERSEERRVGREWILESG